MKLSISKCAFNGLSFVKKPKDYVEACAKSKFRNMDFSFDFVNSDEDYLKSAEEAKETAQKKGIGLTMSHAPFKYNPCANEEFFDLQVEDVRKAMECASLMGIDRMTVHGGATFANNKQDLIQKNVKYYSRLLEYAEKYNVNIMIENISEIIRARPLDIQTADDILQIKKLLNDHPLIKVCWDSGHANTLNLDQYSNITKFKDDLYGLHLHDNYGFNDDHMMPLLGTVNFDEVIKGLKDINYTGPFNFEVHVFNDGKCWPNYRRPFTENSGAESLLFDPDDELRYLGINTMYEIAVYMAKKHQLDIE